MLYVSGVLVLRVTELALKQGCLGQGGEPEHYHSFCVHLMLGRTVWTLRCSPFLLPFGNQSSIPGSLLFQTLGFRVLLTIETLVGFVNSKYFHNLKVESSASLKVRKKVKLLSHV